MVCGCLSIFSSSSFLSISSTDSSSITSPPPPPLKRRYFKLSLQNPRSLKPSSSAILRPSKTGAVPTASIEDGSAEQFLKNNSIADFMRFQRNSRDKGQGELQTAVVTYRKKFPWSVLQPFLQVDLVSTIHIADKEFVASSLMCLQKFNES